MGAMRVTQKLALSVSALFVAVAFVATGLAISHYREQTRNILLSNQDNFTARIAEEADRHLMLLQSALSGLARDATPTIVGDPKAAQAFLDANGGVHALFNKGLCLFTTQGRLLAESPAKARRGVDCLKQSYIQAIVKNRGPMISDPMAPTEEDQGAAVVFSAPVLDKDRRVLAIVTGTLDIAQTNLLGAANTLRWGKGGYIAVMTREGKVLLDASTAPIAPRKPTNSSLIRLLHRGYQGTVELPGANGAMVVSVKRMPVSGWVMVSNLPRAELYAPTDRLTREWILISLAGLLFLVGAVWLLLGHFTRPLEALTEKIRALGVGTTPMSTIEMDAPGEVGALVKAFNSLISQSNLRQNEWFESEKRFRLLAENSTDMISRHAPDGKFVYASPACMELLGYDQEALIGRSLLDFVHFENIEELKKAVLSNRREGLVQTSVYRIQRLNGQYIWCETRSKWLDTPSANMSAEFVCVTRDISTRKSMEDNLSYLASHDALTGLANRMSLQDRFDAAVRHAVAENTMMALLVLDLDRFKNINDTLGHGFGDELLRAAAQRLSQCVRKSDTVARPGGDEFVVLLSNVAAKDAVALVAHKISETLSLPFPLEGQTVHVTVSAGISLYPADGEDLPTLIKNADTALYRVKETGGNAHSFYLPEMNHKALRRLALENALYGAVDRGELELNYQPIMDMHTRSVTGLEALLRWHHPHLGKIEPSQFIPIAEDCGLIIPIGEWVMRSACAQNKQWQNIGLAPIRMAINLSARQFRQPGLLQVFSSILQEVDLEPQYVELELTEGTIMENPERTNAILHGFKAMGAHISIDDFGTGYSSLSYLKRFAIDTLKVDRSFVRDIVYDHGDAAIVSAVIALSHSLKLSVVAEGVETVDQINFLRNHQCDRMQGYFFSRPLSAENITTFLQDNAHVGKSVAQYDFFSPTPNAKPN